MKRGETKISKQSLTKSKEVFIMEMALSLRNNRTYGAELIMPMNAIALENDEMEYVNCGFWNFCQAWNSVNNMGYTLDGIILVAGYAIGIGGGISTIRSLIAKSCRGLTVNATRALVVKAGVGLASTLISTIVGMLGYFMNFSIGSGIAHAWDACDRHPNNGICDF